MQPELHEIPQDQWLPMLDHFSRAHQGQQLECVIVAPDSGQHRQVSRVPLLGISTEPSDGGAKITVIAGSPDGMLFSHEIAHPTRVKFAEWNDGVSGQVEIEAEDGFHTSVKVGPLDQLLPEGAVLDGNYGRQ